MRGVLVFGVLALAVASVNASAAESSMDKAKEDLLRSLQKLRQAKERQLRVAREAAAHRAAEAHRIEKAEDSAEATLVSAREKAGPSEDDEALLRELSGQAALGTGAKFDLGGAAKKGIDLIKGLFGGGGGGGGGGGTPGENEFTKELDSKEQQLQSDVDSDIGKKLAKVKELMNLLKSLFDMFGKGKGGSGSGGGGGSDGGSDGGADSEEEQRRKEEEERALEEARRREEEERRREEEEALRKSGGDPLSEEERRAREEEARRNLEAARRAEEEAEREAQRLEAEMRAEEGKHRDRAEQEKRDREREEREAREAEERARRLAEAEASGKGKGKGKVGPDGLTDEEREAKLAAERARRGKVGPDGLTDEERREKEAAAKYKAQRDREAARLAEERRKWAAQDAAEKARLEKLARQSKGRHGKNCKKAHECEVGAWEKVHALLDQHRLFASVKLSDGCHKDKFGPHESPMDNLDDAADGHKAAIPHHHTSDGGQMCMDPRLAKMILAVSEHGAPEITAFHGEHHDCKDSDSASMAVVIGSVDEHPLDTEHRELAMKVIEACEAAGASVVYNTNRKCGCECKKYHHSVLCAI